MTLEEIKSNFCYYDLRNPDGIKDNLSEEFGYDEEEIKSYGEFSMKDCACDNCFYGRTKLAEELLLYISEIEKLKKSNNETTT